MKTVTSYTDKIYICDISKDSKDITYSELVHSHDQYSIMVITVKGNISIKVNEQNYELKESLFLVLYSLDFLNILKCSQDYQGYIVFISNDFISEHTEGKGAYVKNSLVRLRMKSCIAISIEEKRILLKRVDCLREQILQNKHFYYKASIGNMLEGLFLDINSLLMSCSLKDTFLTFSNKYEIVDKFMTILYTSCSKEHSVSFYARKVGISSQYLTLIVKEYTGKTVSQWIRDALINESVRLLKNPGLTVQQIANSLNFADQSTFGKFFKTHKSVSPQKYRKENFC